MRIAGQLSLLLAFVAIGYAAVANWLGARHRRSALQTSGLACAAVGFVFLTAVVLLVAGALLTKDFRFSYVAQYSNRSLPWHYSLSALWVGQAGSLLLWTWMLAFLAMLFRLGVSENAAPLRDRAFAILLAQCSFLLTIMVFAADPTEANIAPGADGAGLSPLLHHPAMLIHPPIIFLGYAAWAVPCALALAALIPPNPLVADASLPGKTAAGVVDSNWVALARPWALGAWSLLGSGIMLGAYWSYEELGWGGYWAWDPVENGSLIPWLIGSALIHSLMAWQFRGMLRKTCVALAVLTLAMCHFATFLTRSGIFSSLHAFSQSPIGWLFLGFMLLLVGGGGLALALRHGAMRPDRRLTSVWSRESMVVVSVVCLLFFALVTAAGTLSVALSQAMVGRRIMLGPDFYNRVLIPLGLVLLTAVGAAPLLRWGASPGILQQRALLVSAGCGLFGALIGWTSGARHPLLLAVLGLAGFAVAALAAALFLDIRRDHAGGFGRASARAFLAHRRTYAGFLIHMGFVCVALGITGSSLLSSQHEVVLRPGDSVEWSGYSINFRERSERSQPDKTIVEAILTVRDRQGRTQTMAPAQHFHRMQNQWTTEVAIRSTWSSDLYLILHSGDEDGAMRLTLMNNPLMRWMWLGGWIMLAGAFVRLCPWPHRLRIRIRQHVASSPNALARCSRSRNQLQPVRT